MTEFHLTGKNDKISFDFICQTESEHSKTHKFTGTLTIKKQEHTVGGYYHNERSEQPHHVWIMASSQRTLNSRQCAYYEKQVSIIIKSNKKNQ